MADMEELKQCVVDGDVSAVQDLVKQALESGLSAEHILNAGLIAAMSEIGRQFETGECFVPEMLAAARAMQSGLQLLRPHLASVEVRSIGKILLGSAAGDLHDIGKNLVGIMMEGSGFEVVDLGVNIKPEAFVEAVRKHQPQLVGLSALLTTTMVNLKATIDALEAAGLRSQVKVLVGGAPVTEAFALKIGADGYAPDASRAVGVAKALLQI